MKAPFSSYLNGIAPGLKELINLLRVRYDYVSVLSTDSIGFAVSISQHDKSISRETTATERGTVVRVCKNSLYAEVAFTGFIPSEVLKTYSSITHDLDAQLLMLHDTGVKAYKTAILPDEPRILKAEMETDRLPEEENIASLIEKLSAVSDLGIKKGKESGLSIIDYIIHASSTHICKVFLTEHRDLRQSYTFSDALTVGLVTDDKDHTHMAYTALSSRKGPELFDHLEDQIPEVLRIGKDLVSSEHIIPGEYDVITSPEVTGLIAHEAFGHGVEMDLFVKNRALGADHIGKRVGSDLVSMHEGALCTDDVASYAFDDEGTLACDITEIDKGILCSGICDALSALRLGVKPTGNGRRESFSHKTYTRMTNTMFESGTNTLQEMITSIKYGYLLEGIQSGMEDPKHWGIQCVLDRGYEIIDGKLTGKVVSPLVMTGYVPDLLRSVSMLSVDRKSYSIGVCGKGHKEYVKVADGGPYMKVKARLG